MRLPEDFFVLNWVQYQLMAPLCLSSPESAVVNEEMPRTPNEFAALRGLHVANSGRIAEKAVYALNFVIARQ